MDKSVNNLVCAYRELQNSKMVLAEKQISKLLKVVADNDSIYNLIAEKILGYDFKRGLEDLQSANITVEEIASTDEVIPFVFCLLNDIDNRQIQTVAFIRQVFKSDSEEAYKEFNEKLVGSFVNRITKLLGTEINESVEVNDDPADQIEKMFTSGLIERVGYILSVISEKVNGLKKIKLELKRDIDVISFSIDLCLNEGEYLGIMGLLTGLKCLLTPLKKFKAEIEEIELIQDAINEI